MILFLGGQFANLVQKAKRSAQYARAAWNGKIRAGGRRRREADHGRAMELARRNVQTFINRSRKSEIASRENDPGWATGAREEEHPSRVLREFSDRGDGVGTYFKRMLELDPMLDALWTTRNDQVLDLPVTVEPRDETPQSREAAAICEKSLETIENLHDYFSHQMMADYYGVTFAEPVYVNGPLAGRQNVTYPVYVHQRPMQRFAFVNGEARVRTRSSEFKKIPWGRMFIHRAGDTDSPWGAGKADCQHVLWGTKQEVMMAWATAVDRHWLPPLKAKIRDDEDIAYAEALLDAFAEGASGLIETEEVQVDVMDHRGTQAPFGGLIRNLDVTLALSTLGAGDVVGLSQEHGSFARAEVGMQVVGGRRGRLANALARHIECTLFKVLTAVNVGPDVPVPRLNIRTFSDDEILKQIQILEKWVEMNREAEEKLEIGSDLVRRIFGYPDVHFTDTPWNYARPEAQP